MFDRTYPKQNTSANRYKDLVYLFISLNLWLCVTSVVMVVATAVALSEPVQGVGGGLVLPSLLVYAVYVEDRRRISDADRINAPRRTQLVETYDSLLGLTAIGALIGYELILVAFVLEAGTIGLEYVLLGQVPLIVLALYATAKRYATFDSLVVATAWSLSIVLSVLVATGQPISRASVIVFCLWFLIAFAGVESRNIDDIPGDTALGKRTLAGYLGRKNTRILVVGLKGFATGLFWYRFGPTVGALVVAHLLLLWFFRQITPSESGSQ